MLPAATVVYLVPAEGEAQLFPGQDEGVTGVRTVGLDQVRRREGRELPAQGPPVVRDRVRPGAYGLE